MKLAQGHGRGVAGLRAGASTIALAAIAMTFPASAQQEVPGSIDTTQEAAPGADVGETPDNGDTIVVTGRRAALEAAEDRKRRSETILDSIVADDAGRLPDNSITEVLQRVSGVSIVRFAALGDPDHYSAQGSGVQVRGLTGVASRLNGREIFSANGGRAILWSDVTPELMAAVDVYKASTADLIEGGTGGQIDLRTKMPFDFDDGEFHLAGTAEVSAGDLAEKFDPMASVLLTDSFDTGIGRIGVLADIAYSQFSSLSQFIRVEPYLRTRIGARDYYVPAGFTYGEEAFRYRRNGLYGAVQWQPNDDLTFSATYFQTKYNSRSSDYGAQVSSQALAVDPANSTFDDDGLLLRTDSLFNRDTATFLPSTSQVNSSGNKGYVDSETKTQDYSLSFIWDPEDGPLKISGALQRVDSRQIYDRLDIFREVGFGLGFGMDLTGDLPLITVSPGVRDSFANPANYLWSASMPHNEDNKGRLDTAQLDLEYEFDDSFFRSIKVGGRVAERTERDFANGYNWAALGRGWNGDPQLTFANAAPGDVDLYIFKDFFRGETALPGNLYFATEELAARLDRTELTQPPPAGFCPPGTEFNCSASGPLPRTGYGGAGGIRPVGFVLPDDRVDNQTMNYAAYALARFGPEFDEEGISGNVGVRVVHIENEGSGFVRQSGVTFIRDGRTFTLTNSAVPRGGKAEFTRVLPSINLAYSPTPDIKLRASYNITLDLPTFNALRASGGVGVATTSNPVQGQPGIFTNFTAETGNPLLKPALSNNIDFSAEYYLTAGTSFHFAPFYKRLTNMPIFSLTEREVTVVYADGTSETATAAATDYSNAEEAAEVKGFEVGGRFFLDWLSGFVSGFGFEGNYTFIDSKNPGDVYRDINGQIRSDAPLVGLSRHNFNATLLYERDPISFRVAYSWRSKYLQSTNSNGTNPSFPYYSAPGVVTNLLNGTATNTQIALPVYGDKYGSLDAGIRLRVNENVSVGIQGTNLTAATQRTLMGGYPGGLRGRSWFQADRRLNLGVNVSF
ncbi:TonB-dependent receptor (plasmid) [Croceibacterium sp. TMG7-5b_MA50]|uniref:TonB-dependent receptor n=1 Tax=Croceibacterium sp. TMG7-5b_MA50 TaxID=3121290 RepID=UPI003221FDF5